MDPKNPPERLRIAHLILSTGFAGSERSTAESCIAQCRDHDVLLVVRRGHRKQKTGASIVDHLDPRVKVVEIPARLFTQRHLQRALDEFRPDVVHAHLRRSTRLLSRCRVDGVKVSTLHIEINGPQFLQMDGLVCISPWQLRTIPAEYRGLAVMIRNSLLPQPKIDAARRETLRAEMGAGPGVFLIGGVGRLGHSKGWDVLLHAYAEAQLPDTRLALIGEGSERGKLERLAGPAVQFLGFRPSVKDYYQAFDLFVCPSRTEPMGRVILEALDAGVPVISSDASGPKEILTEYPGVLVPVGDVGAMARALRSAWERRGEPPAPVDVSAHHLDRVSVEMVQFYRDLLHRRRSGASGPPA
ncbi:glycosyltransferase [Solimonas sp. K1W22B-7]|uniref:glycosyltransferase n=1 Tax=Solimonas sp. K1W22B-7 TaxID=2303331 RepID=UPI000E3343C6|nr:glycosyltransferase [Solimonas sp. K1W22B-7]AXQ28864.1 glycosyltransferase [Solimonas sp. K1W22B-7]